MRNRFQRAWQVQGKNILILKCWWDEQMGIKAERWKDRRIASCLECPVGPRDTSVAAMNCPTGLYITKLLTSSR